MNTIKINIPNGFKIKKFDEQNGEVSFEPIPKSPREILNTWDDILEFHNTNSAEFKQWCENSRLHEMGGRKEEMIVAAYNGRQLNDPLPDWRDGKPKRYPIFNMPDASGAGFSFHDFGLWFAASCVGSRLVYFGDESLENLRDAVKKFLPEYKESRTL
jgi:hypothetical protein